MTVPQPAAAPAREPAPDANTRTGLHELPVLHVIMMRVPALGEDSRIVGDGSAPAGLAGPSGISGCAAVAGDGRLLAAWFEHPPMPRMSIYAEWQALRLSMRLAAAYPPGTATLVTDNRQAAASAGIVLGGGRPADLLGVHDPAASGEIRLLAAAGRPSITVRGGKQSRSLTAATAPARTAHTAAWLVRRMAAEGIDPERHADWIARVAARAPRWKEDLRRTYFRRFGRRHAVCALPAA